MSAILSRGPAGRQSSVVRMIPMAYLAIGVLLVVVVLPSALRPPPDTAQTSGELSPDAPPDDNPESIISSLRGASSQAGGTGAGEGGAGRGAPNPPVETRPSKGVCYGDPPRQIESLYAAPCTPAWQGDNGGATHLNVTGDQVNVGVSHVTGNGTVGEVPDADEPRDNETSQDRTLRVLQAFFNKNFEFYGRKFQIYQVQPSSPDPAEQRNHAVEAAEEFKLFASYYLYSGFCEDFARRTLVTICNPMPEQFHSKWAPYVWAWMMDYSKVDRMGTEYICKKLKGKNADFGGAEVQRLKRKFGLLYQSAPARNGGRTSSYMKNQLEQQCGITDVEALDIQGDDADTDKWAEAAIRLRAAGVTSVVLQTELAPAVQIMAAADGAAWFPEWLFFFPYGLDINFIGLLMPQEQMEHVFGLSAWEMPTSNQNTDCYRAYKTIDPNTDPNATTCGVFFPHLLMLANGIQEAGPNLTPETFRDGQFSIGHRFYPQPWAIGGGYGPNDYTYMDNMGEIWWDASATQPETGASGAYRWVRNGKRYREGEQPVEDPLVFQDGVSTRPG